MHHLNQKGYALRLVRVTACGSPQTGVQRGWWLKSDPWPVGYYLKGIYAWGSREPLLPRGYRANMNRVLVLHWVF